MNKIEKANYNAEYHRTHKAAIAHRKAEHHRTHRAEILQHKAEYRQTHKYEIAKYYQTHKAKRDEYQTEYNQIHKVKIAKHKAEYYQTHMVEMTERQAQYRQTHRAEIAHSGAKYYQMHKDERAKYIRDRRRTNIQCRLAGVLRSRLGSAIKGGYKAGSAVGDLGCSIGTFRLFIENQFEPGMTWDNYGEWHLDHVQPLASFDLTDRSQFITACNWLNYQPLWAVDNIRKGDKI